MNGKVSRVDKYQIKSEIGFVKWVRYHLTVITTDIPLALKFWIELKFGMLVFEEKGKLQYQERNISEEAQEPTLNLTHMLITNGRV